MDPLIYRGHKLNRPRSYLPQTDIRKPEVERMLADFSFLILLN
jgi:hypothetical protein